jgi:RHS repeat-associated protein
VQTYDYDAAGRLTAVRDTVDGPAGATCTIRAYQFDDATNRTAVHTAGADGDTCPAPPSSATRAWTYAADAFGRFTTVPGADTAKPLDGNLAVAYHANDLVRTLTQNGRTTTYTLDVDQNRVRSWTDATGGVTTTRTHHYDGSSDNPAWTDEGTGWTRNIGGIGGDLSAIHHSATGTTTYQLANLHGDVVGTTGTDGTLTAANGTADEYGTPRDTATIGQRRYGWLGTKQRAADTPGGLTLMGVRLYNPTTGRFLSTDPIAGGSCNDYEYVCANPVNAFDLDGRYSVTKLNCRRFYCTRHIKFNKRETTQIEYGAGGLAAISGGLAFLLGPAAGIVAALLGSLSAYAGYQGAIGRCVHIGVFYGKVWGKKVPEYAWVSSYRGGYCK